MLPVRYCKIYNKFLTLQMQQRWGHRVPCDHSSPLLGHSLQSDIGYTSSVRHRHQGKMEEEAWWYSRSLVRLDYEMLSTFTGKLNKNSCPTKNKLNRCGWSLWQPNVYTPAILSRKRVCQATGYMHVRNICMHQSQLGLLQEKLKYNWHMVKHFLKWTRVSLMLYNISRVACGFIQRALYCICNTLCYQCDVHNIASALPLCISHTMSAQCNYKMVRKVNNSISSNANSLYDLKMPHFTSNLTWKITEGSILGEDLFSPHGVD